MIKSRKQSSTTYPINIFLADLSDHITGKTGLTPTVTISKNGGAFAAAAGAVTEIGNGWYSLAGNATDRETLGELLIHAEASGADPFDGQYCIVDFNPFIFKPPVSLSAADVSGNVPVDVSAIQSGLATGTNVSDAQTAIISAVNAATPEIDFPTAVEIRQEMDGNSTQLAAILEDTGTTIPGLINADSGAGAISWTYTLTDSDDGTPIDGAEVWVTTDAAGEDVVASGSTNSFGVVTFMLDAGAYYFWRKCSGYNFNNPDLETVS